MPDSTNPRRKAAVRCAGAGNPSCKNRWQGNHLLRPGRERPRRRAAQKGNELASAHTSPRGSERRSLAVKTRSWRGRRGPKTLYDDMLMDFAKSRSTNARAINSRASKQKARSCDRALIVSMKRKQLTLPRPQRLRRHRRLRCRLHRFHRRRCLRLPSWRRGAGSSRAGFRFP